MTTLTDTALREAYERHFTRHKRHPSRALGWPATVWLLEALTRRDAKQVLECGSGWTTTALRLWASEMPGRQVTTTDHAEVWLNVARLELEYEGLTTDRLYVHEDFAAAWHGEVFDAVLVDLANPRVRVARLPEFVRYIAPRGLLVFDDWHISWYADEVALWFRTHDYDTPVPFFGTTDEFGRYVAVWGRS